MDYLWQAAVGVGAGIAGFFAAFRRLRQLPKQINGQATALMNLEIDLKRLLNQIKTDAEIAARNIREVDDDILDRIRRNTEDIRDIRHRLRKLEGTEDAS